MGHKQIRNETPEEGCGLSSSSRTSIIYTSIHAHSHFSPGWFRAQGPGIQIGMFPLRRTFQLSRSLTADQRPPKSRLESPGHLQDNRQLSGPPPRFLSMLKRLCHHSQYLSSLSDHHQPTSVTSTPAAVSAILRPSPYKTHTRQFQEQRRASPCKVPKLNQLYITPAKRRTQKWEGLYLNIFLCETVTP